MALIEFYGKECPHCVDTMPLIERLKKEGFNIEQYETWHNEKNACKQEEYDKNLCGGVPFFINTESGGFVCGAADYETLKSWAEGNK